MPVECLPPKLLDTEPGRIKRALDVYNTHLSFLYFLTVIYPAQAPLFSFPPIYRDVLDKNVADEHGSFRAQRAFAVETKGTYEHIILRIILSVLRALLITSTQYSSVECNVLVI